jgi:hypothetical protein
VGFCAPENQMLSVMDPDNLHGFFLEVVDAQVNVISPKVLEEVDGVPLDQAAKGAACGHAIARQERSHVSNVKHPVPPYRFLLVKVRLEDVYDANVVRIKVHEEDADDKELPLGLHQPDLTRAHSIFLGEHEVRDVKLVENGSRRIITPARKFRSMMPSFS